ncbi:unnamed protein product, partial [Discosporangium mesarthrocarpum]
GIAGGGGGGGGGGGARSGEEGSETVDNMPLLLQMLDTIMSSYEDAVDPEGSYRVQLTALMAHQVLRGHIRTQHNLQPYPGTIFLPTSLYRPLQASDTPRSSRMRDLSSGLHISTNSNSPPAAATPTKVGAQRMVAGSAAAATASVASPSSTVLSPLYSSPQTVASRGNALSTSPSLSPGFGPSAPSPISMLPASPGHISRSSGGENGGQRADGGNKERVRRRVGPSRGQAGSATRREKETSAGPGVGAGDHQGTAAEGAKKGLLSPGLASPASSVASERNGS